MRRDLVGALQRLEGRNDRVVIDLGGAALGDAGGGERRIVAQHAIRLVTVVAPHAIRLDAEYEGDAEGQHEQRGHDAASAPGHANVHGLNNPSRCTQRQPAALGA